MAGEDGRAEPRIVTTGLEGPERVEINQGLMGDERVIVRGHEGLYAGARVSDVSGKKTEAGSDVSGDGRGRADDAGQDRLADDDAGHAGDEDGESPAKTKEGEHAGH